MPDTESDLPNRHKPRVIHNHSQLDTCTPPCPLHPDHEPSLHCGCKPTMDGRIFHECQQAELSPTAHEALALAYMTKSQQRDEQQNRAELAEAKIDRLRYVIRQAHGYMFLHWATDGRLREQMEEALDA